MSLSRPLLLSNPSLNGWDLSNPSLHGRNFSNPSLYGRDLSKPSHYGKYFSNPSVYGWDSYQRSTIVKMALQRHSSVANKSSLIFLISIVVFPCSLAGAIGQTWCSKSIIFKTGWTRGQLKGVATRSFKNGLGIQFIKIFMEGSYNAQSSAMGIPMFVEYGSWSLLWWLVLMLLVSKSLFWFLVLWLGHSQSATTSVFAPKDQCCGSLGGVRWRRYLIVESVATTWAFGPAYLFWCWVEVIGSLASPN